MFRTPVGAITTFATGNPEIGEQVCEMEEGIGALGMTVAAKNYNKSLSSPNFYPVAEPTSEIISKEFTTTLSREEAPNVLQTYKEGNFIIELHGQLWNVPKGYDVGKIPYFDLISSFPKKLHYK